MVRPKELSRTKGYPEEAPQLLNNIENANSDVCDFLSDENTCWESQEMRVKQHGVCQV
jgi:hypothetical protein